MGTRTGISRRRILGMGAAALACRAAHAAEALRRTPTQVLGPFYPLDKPLDTDADLTLIRGRQRRAEGQVLHVMGRVVSSGGEPVKGARIEIWQANARGRYVHPSDDNDAPLDPNFEGYAELRTDDLGRYRFKTIKPGAYRAGGQLRPAHIHFDVSGRVNRLITQMYFPEDPHLAGDVVLATANENGRLLLAEIGQPGSDMEPDSLLARWDIVLQTG